MKPKKKSRTASRLRIVAQLIHEMFPDDPQFPKVEITYIPDPRLIVWRARVVRPDVMGKIFAREGCSLAQAVRFLSIDVLAEAKKRIKK